MTITRLAPAKINLMLHVVGRLADGYHHLQSLVIFVGVGDQVTIEKVDNSRLTVDGPFATHVPLTPENSIVLAARWVKERFPRVEQAHIHLMKNLPISSGIGGGSSDAAATIAGLLACFEISLSKAEEDGLILASGELGADVPMCLAYQFRRGPMLWIDSSGREALPESVKTSLPGVIVLANPGKPVSTASIFKSLHPSYTPPQNFQNVLDHDFKGNILEYLRAQKNDLMKPAILQEPSIEKALETLKEAPGCYLARMSGSGATCFALFVNEESAWLALSGMSLSWSAITHYDFESF